MEKLSFDRDAYYCSMRGKKDNQPCIVYVRVPLYLLDALEFEISFNRHITNNPAISIARALRIMTVLNSVNEHAEDELSKQLSELKNVRDKIEIRFDSRLERLSTESRLVLDQLVEASEDKYKRLFSN